MTMTGSQTEVRQQVTVAVPAEKAFAFFTERFDDWWPMSHHIGAEMPAARVIESGVGGRWAAVAVAASQPLHLISVIISSHPLDLVGWGLQAVGFAAVGWAILRMPNDEWQPLPYAVSAVKRRAA